MDFRIALFGEAQKGDFQAAYLCKSVEELAHHLGEPPNTESKGISYAIQALLYKRDVIFFRVHEEGFSTQDYLRGLSLLENRKLVPSVTAICLPGVGNTQIIDATAPICQLHRSFLILTEKDLYDYLTYS